MKKLFLLFSILILTTHLFSQDVGAILNAPNSATQGQEFEISITVNKADVTGFARIQLDLPAGFTVKASQTQGATFSFKDNKVRFLWMSLPADKTLNISCLATADNSVSGNINIEGAFSYVLNNETQRFTIPAHTIQFGGGNLASSEDSNKIEAERLEKERQEKLAQEQAEHDRIEREKAEKEAQANAEKEAQQYAESQNTSSTPEISTSTPSEITNPENNNTPSEVVNNSETNTSNPEIANTPEIKSTNQDLTPSENVISNPSNNTSNEPVSNNYASNSNSYNSSNSSSAESVEYKIQIGAFKSSPASGYFRKLENNVSEFQVKSTSDPDGYVRYFIGSFNNFSSVNNFHKKVLQLGYSSFIVANKDGKKITIREAKEISKN